MDLTEKWVARFIDGDGKESMGLANHHSAVSNLLAAILHCGGTHITLIDETCRPRTIEGEINNEQCREVHPGTIGHSTVEEHE